MMPLTRNIINKHEDTHDEFGYYKIIIDKIEENVSSNSDIAIECSKSLIEGICKTIFLRLDESITKNEVDSFDVQDLFKNTCWRLSTSKYPIEEAFSRQGYNLVKRMGEIRNDRGDISHGKSSPKEFVSTKQSARMIMGVTDSISHYLLDHFFKIDLSHKDELQYEDNPEFNEYLDEAYLDFSVSYSEALFYQDRVAYEEQLRDFKDEQGIEDE